MSGTASSRLRSKPWAGLPPWCSRHHCQDLGYLLWAYQLAGFLGSPFELQRCGREPEKTLECTKDDSWMFEPGTDLRMQKPISFFFF